MATNNELHPSYNEALKAAFQELHDSVIASVDVSSVIISLFARKVIGTPAVFELDAIPNRLERCHRLLMLLHSSNSPDAFVKLHRVLSDSSTCGWLVDEIDRKYPYYLNNRTTNDGAILQHQIIHVGGPPGVLRRVLQDRTNIIETYAGRQSIGLGITLVVAALVSIICNAVEMNAAITAKILFTFGYFGHGFWCSVMCFITGCYGITAGRRKTKCQIVSFCTLCIIETLFAVVQFVMALTGAISSSSLEASKYGASYVSASASTNSTIVATESSMAVLAFVEIVSSIWGIVICGKAYCCCICCECCYECCCCGDCCCCVYGDDENDQTHTVEQFDSGTQSNNTRS